LSSSVGEVNRMAAVLWRDAVDRVSITLRGSPDLSMMNLYERIAAFGRLALVWTALLAFAAVWVSPAAARDTRLFRRGVGVHDAMNWATMDAAKKTYVYPPFSDANHPLTDDELAAIKKAGFDFIRLTIDPGPFLQFQGAQLDGTYDILRQRVQTILKAGFAVVVDFHPVEQAPQYLAIADGKETSLFKPYCDMLQRTVALLSGFSGGHIALELMNEPQVGWTQAGSAAWQAMAEKFYAAARMGSPRLPLIITGGDGGNFTGLTKLDPKPFAQDSEAFFTFHYYLPYQFTMQSLYNEPTLQYERDVPYPADARPLSDSMAALSAYLQKTKASSVDSAAETAKIATVLGAYRLKGFDRQTIHSAFDQVSIWASANNIPVDRIFLGEFGVVRRYGRYDGARENERMLWLHDIRQEAEQHGFFWSIWAYRGPGGMAITKDDSTTEVDPDTRVALGLAK
jgi:endoglucanase